MPTFPSPEFINDKKSGQLLFIEKFKRELTNNFIALSPTAYDDMLNLVSDCCEAFYQCSTASKGWKELYKEAKTELQERNL